MATLPLVVSTDGRWLEYSDGAAFHGNGDAAWVLPVDVSLSDVGTYLDDRQAKGVNLIICMLIAHDQTNNTPRWENVNGDLPFTGTLAGGGQDFTTPNTAYWSHVDAVLDAAASRGIVVLAFPAYDGFEHGTSGWAVDMAANGTAGMTTYGTFIGNRYQNQTNILWGMAGDAPPNIGTIDLTDEINALANAIKAAGATQPMTAKSERGSSSVDDYNQTWLDVNASYATAANIHLEVRTSRQQAVMPTFLIEGWYGNEHSMTDLGVRTEMYQAILGGGFGHIYGAAPIWYFGEDAAHPKNSVADTSGLDWHEQLDLLGAQYLTHVATLQGLVDLSTLTPDYAHTVVTAGFGASENATYAPVMASSQKLVAYTRGGTLTVDRTQFDEGLYAVNWFNVRDGTTTAGGTVAFAPSSGSAALKAPDSNDWALLVQLSSLGDVGVVIHSEDFTATQDTELSTFDADWTKFIGGTETLQVVAEGDRLECPDASAGVNVGYLWNGTGSPTGDQHVSAKAHPIQVAGSGSDFIGVAARCSTASGGSAYLVMAGTETGAVRLTRLNAGAFTPLDTKGTVVTDTTYELTVRVTGTNPVLIEVDVVGQGTIISHQDSTASRLTSGPAGVFLSTSQTSGDASPAWLDDWSVSDPNQQVSSGTGARGLRRYYRRGA